MDFFYTCLLSLFVVVAVMFRFLLYKSKPVKLPPGKVGWPVIGESLEFLASGWKGHPEKFIFDRMAKFSPHVFRTSLFLEDFAVFCGSRGNKFLFSNENKLVHAWWPTSVDKVFDSSRQTSKSEAMKMRKMLSDVLHPEALHRYIPVMDMVAKTHFASRWDGRDTVVAFRLTKDFTFRIACSLFMSIDEPERVRCLSGPFEDIARGILSIPIDLPGTTFRRGIRSARFVREELVAIVKQRKIDLSQGKASPTQDILSHMLLYKNEDGSGCMSTEYEIANKILGLLIGGHDTTSCACASVVKYLAELPEVYEKVYKEQMEVAKSKLPDELLNWKDVSKMKYSWNVACEVLRLAPPVHGAFREAITDFTYNGFFVPKGWKLYWSAYATHKDSEFFSEPEKFDPSRFSGKGPAPYTFVPFGGGPRMCPGKEYARLEILVFMHYLVRKFKWEKLIPDEDITVNPMASPSKGLPIRLYPRKA